MGKCVKFSRLLSYLRTPYDERKDTISVSEIYRRVQAIREKAGFQRFYTCQDQDNQQSHLCCSTIVREIMRRLHYEEIAWLSISDRQRFEIAYGDRFAGFGPKSCKSSYSSKITEGGAASRVSKCVVLSQQARQDETVSDDTEDALLLEALVVASFAADQDSIGTSGGYEEQETPVAGGSRNATQESNGQMMVESTTDVEVSPESCSLLPVLVRRSAEEVKNRQILMKRIISELKKRPVNDLLKKTTSMALTGPGRTPYNASIRSPAKEQDKPTKQVTSQQLAAVKLRKTGYKSGQYVGQPMASRSRKKKEDKPVVGDGQKPRVNSYLQMKQTKVQSGPMFPQASPSAHLLKKIENIQKKRKAQNESKKESRLSFRELADKMKTRRQIINPDSQLSITPVNISN